MARKWNRVVGLTRSLHIYLTMFAMLLMLFFAATGFLLNHEEWITDDEAPPTELHGTIPVALLGATPDKLMIVEQLRNVYHAVGAVTTFDVDTKTLRVELRGPGRHFEAEIDRMSGDMSLRVEQRAFLVRMDDLHRGKDSGSAWSLVIDLSALLLLAAALTGIILWIALPKRRKLGLLALGGGIAICLGVYWTVVP